ncbi:MAG: GT4 family glycosyltransferase PelF [Verrucomicrobia bacterium]|nr:GT4 family glycosyltransferase PelF [Verrucomicrobiota bacterium]
MSHTNAQQIADVGLFLEGTYPYVLGGVSAWVDQIIRGLPELTFSLFYIGSERKANQEPLYPLPSNVLSLEEVYLHDRLPESDLKPARTPSARRKDCYRWIANFYLSEQHDEKAPAFWKMIDCLDALDGLFTFGNLCSDRDAWEILLRAYDGFAQDESFIDFFWTLRFVHMPLWMLWQSRNRVPKARVYHSVSAGYAGLIGAICARRNRVPFFLTEHGIYTKERIAEISQADWIYEESSHRITFSEGLGKLKQIWIGLFAFLGQLAYDQAERILTLYDGNAATQIEFGADRNKITVILFKFMKGCCC